MPRRPWLFVALVASLTIAACSPTPVAPALTDPKEILTKAVEATLKAKSVHFQATVTGSFNADLMGTGQASDFELDGTTAEGDVDIAGKKLRATFSAPAFLGLSGEVIQVGTTSYFKTSLTGAQYQKQVADQVSVDEVTDPAKVAEGVRKALATRGISPTKVADSSCGDNKDCYNVEFDMSAEELAALASAPPDAELAGSSFRLTIGVEKDSLRISRLAFSADMPEQGSIDVTFDTTKWDEAVGIEEPPADQAPPPRRGGRAALATRARAPVCGAERDLGSRLPRSGRMFDAGAPGARPTSDWFASSVRLSGSRTSER